MTVVNFNKAKKAGAAADAETAASAGGIARAEAERAAHEERAR